ncbi:MAG: DMT family transporter [Candidatus Tectomicrobia bacterium]|nr:DMT family transporter [Candidatus Tectomicrobia bacterium]
MLAPAPVFALVTALCIGTADFSSHYGLRHVRALSGAFFSVCFQWLTLGVILSIRGKWEIGDWRGPAIFFLQGMLHPGIFFVFLFLSIARLGPARAITLKGTSPFFSVAIALFFLGERPSPAIYVGLFLVAGGVMSLTAERGGRVRLGKELAFPLIAAFLSGVGPNLAKLALRYMNDPPLGVLFGVSGAMATLFIANTVLSGKVGGRFWLRASPFGHVLLFCPMGTLAAFGFIAYYTALSLGSVAVVAPLVQTAPFVAILLSRLLIQEQEGVNLRLVFSAVAVVLGAALITTGRA